MSFQTPKSWVTLETILEELSAFSYSTEVTSQMLAWRATHPDRDPEGDWIRLQAERQATQKLLDIQAKIQHHYQNQKSHRSVGTVLSSDFDSQHINKAKVLNHDYGGNSRSDQLLRTSDCSQDSKPRAHGIPVQFKFYLEQQCAWLDRDGQRCIYRGRGWNLQRHLQTHIKQDKSILTIQQLMNSPTQASLIHKTDTFTVIRHPYPKSSIHVILFPQEMAKGMSLLDQLQQPPMLAAVRQAVTGLRKQVANELGRLLGHHSLKESQRQLALINGVPELQLPIGRDWTQDINIGVHIYPPLDRFQIHFFSVDQTSRHVRHASHYNSLRQPYLLDLDILPVPSHLVSLDKQITYLDASLQCWSCGHDFDNKIDEFIEHLEEEKKTWLAQ